MVPRLWDRPPLAEADIDCPASRLAPDHERPPDEGVRAGAAHVLQTHALVVDDDAV
jgi:hypothetical protein